MATIKEDCVSFETAKLLKEKGFNEPCWFWYNPIGEFRRHYSKPAESSPCYETACPTLQMACKWLRIKHNLCVTPIMTSKVIREKYGCWEAYIYYYKGEFAGIDATINACGHIFGETPEDVLEEGIKYCLEHLI